MAKSHKTCMEQAEIIDTFGMYQIALVYEDSDLVDQFELLRQLYV